MIRDKVANLVQEIAKTEEYKEENLKFVEERLQSIGNYISKVYMSEMQINIIMARYEGQEQRDYIMKLDNDRRIAHNSAIDAVNQLNRAAELYHCEPIAEIDTNDRYAVHDFCKECVDECFDDKSGRTFSLEHFSEGCSKNDELSYDQAEDDFDR